MGKVHQMIHWNVNRKTRYAEYYNKHTGERIGEYNNSGIFFLNNF